MISPREATAGNTPPATPRPEVSPNYLGRFVEWLRDPNTPLLSKMAAAFLIGLGGGLASFLLEMSFDSVFVAGFGAGFIFTLFNAYVWRG